MKYQNECYACGHKWNSETDYEDCPECGETYYLGRQNAFQEVTQRKG